MRLRMGVSVLLVLALAFAGCGGGGGGGGGGGPDPVSISGLARVGAVDGGSVRIFRLFDNGARGPEVASGTTGSDGSFDIDVGEYRGPVLVCVTGGTYTNEFTGASETIPEERPLYSIAEITDTGAGDVLVTPLTTMSSLLATRLAFDPNSTVTRASRNADISIGRHFGGVDVRTTPASLTDSGLTPGPAADAALAIGTVSQIAIDAEIVEMDATHALGLDFADFLADGLENGNPVMSLGGDPLASLGDPAALSAVLARVLDGTILGPDDTGLDDDLAGRSDAALNAPPRIRAVKGMVTTTTGGGFAATRFAEGIDPAGLQIYLENEFVEVEVTDFEELGIDFLSFPAPSGLDAGAYDLKVVRNDDGQETMLADAFHVVDGNAPVSPGTLRPTEVSTAGGERIRLVLPQALPTTSVTVDGVSAPVLNVVPGRYLEFAAPPGNGPGDVTVANAGPSSTIPNGLTRRDRGLGLESTVRVQSGQTVLIGGLTQGFDGSTPFARSFLTTVTPANTDTGTFSRAVREYRPDGQVTESVVNGDSFLQSQGESLSLLNGSGSDQLFHIVYGARNGVMSGLHAGGVSVVMNPRSTPLALSDLEGEWPFAGTYRDFSGEEPRFASVLGSIAFDAEGNGGLSARLSYRGADDDREERFISSPSVATLSGSRARIEVGEDLPFLDSPQLEILPNDSGTIWLLRSLTAGTGAFQAFALSGIAGYPVEAEEGAFVGGKIGARYDEGNLQYSQDLTRRIVAVVKGSTQSFRFEEKVEGVTAIDPNGTFDEGGRLSLSGYLGVDGFRYRGDRPLGILDPDSGLEIGASHFGVFQSGVKLEVAPSISGDRRAVSLSIYPTVEGFTRFETHQSPTTIATDARIPDGGTVVLGGLTKRTERAVNGGVPFLAEIPTLGELFSQRTATRHRNELVVFLKPTIFDTVEEETIYGASPRIEGEGRESLEVASRGIVSSDNAVAALRDSGDGVGSELRVVLDGVDDTVPIAGTYHAGGVQFSFDGETGALTAFGFRGTVAFDAPTFGAASFNLVTREERENGSVVAGTVAGGGTWSLAADGTVTLALPGGSPVYTGAATADGELLVLVERSLATRAGIMVLVKASSTGAPPVGSYSGITLDFEFTDTSSSPAAFAVSTGERFYTTGGGAINLSGITRQRTTAGGPPVLQQLFQVSSLTTSANGAFTLVAGGETRRGGLSPSGKYGFAVPGDGAIGRISIDLLLAE